jgi:hypothetical protein
MSTTNYIEIVYSRLWDLLGQYPPLARSIPPGNRIRLDAGSPIPFKTAKQDSDFPEVVLLAAGGVDTEFSSFKTFPLANPGAIPIAQTWIETWTETFTLTINHRDLQLNIALCIEAAALAALRLGGPRLGLPFVHRWGQIAISREITSGRSPPFDTAGADGTRRLASTLEFAVTLRLSGADELSA